MMATRQMKARIAMIATITITAIKMATLILMIITQIIKMVTTIMATTHQETAIMRQMALLAIKHLQQEVAYYLKQGSR